MEKKKRINSDDIVNLIVNESLKKKKKSKKNDLQLTLPEQFIKKVEKVNYLYIGLNKYQIKYDTSSVYILTSFISRVLNNTYRYVTTNNKTIANDWDTILFQMITVIAKYNSIVLPVTIEYKILEINIANPECIFFIGNVFYLNARMIRKVMDRPFPELSIIYSDDLKFQENPEMILFNEHQDIKTVNLDITRKLIMLMVIADHACAHYFQSNRQDFVNHKNFASHYFTLHSKLLLEPLNDGKNLVKIANDCNLSNYIEF